LTDLEVIASLAALWSRSGWRRLEISRHDGRYGGYCVPAPGSPVQTADALSGPACPQAIAQLVALIDTAGWQRLEITGNPLTGHASGWCQRADGGGFRLEHIPERSGS
jgi:hypothetical protein